MRILVTGGTGFSGHALVMRLLQDGHEVVALDNKPGLDDDTIRNAGGKIIYGSVTDRACVEEAVEGCEVVQHLAAAFRDVGASDEKYREVNVRGTEIVAEASVKAGVRKLVYCSTCGVHGNVENPPAGEDAPIAPADYYQQTKYEGEVALEAFRDRIEYTIIRPAAIFGPGDPERFSMIFKRVAAGTFPMFGNGKTTYHPVYIDNLVEALIAVMPSGVGAYEAYLIADKEYVTLNDLITRVAKALDRDVTIRRMPIGPLIVAGHVCETICKPFGIAPPIFPRRVDWYRQNRAFRIDKAQRDFGYTASVSLDEGLRRTGEWYRANSIIPS
ncbi:NAD-dependent epimerase/dehydratase family protein [Tropicimonas aquimaris]|uniref:NAD-dependent epimerase/dehydratase family protein n=1 Tax=Tropicimonas aquimaris TaxID=914152 RepID=A0ABW3ISD6_9RHOB